ncbi:hypothetical protein ACS0TY_033257 [Phlomoides rotata]
MTSKLISRIGDYFVMMKDEDVWTRSLAPSFSAIDSYRLPDNVAIITLQELANKEVLLRLAHLYEEGERKGKE